MPNSNSGTISATGSGNAISVPVNTLQGDSFANITIQGTYTSPTVRVEAQDPVSGSYVGISCVDQSQNGLNYAAGYDIPLTTNTTKALKVYGVGGYTNIRVYATAGTGLTMAVYLSTWPGLASQNVVVQLNQTGMLAPVTITGGSATAFVVGPNTTTNPALTVDDSASSCATGLKLTGAAAASGFAMTITSSGTDESATLDAKGAGSFTIQGTATGNFIHGRGIVHSSAVSPTAFSASADDLAIGNVYHVRVTTNNAGPQNFTGMTGGVEGREVYITNIGSTDSIVIKHDVTSTAANRFYCANAADVTLRKLGSVMAVYDGTLQRWMVQGA